MEETPEKGARAFAVACGKLENELIEVFAKHSPAMEAAILPGDAEHTRDLLAAGGMSAMLAAGYFVLAAATPGTDAERRAELRHEFLRALALLEALRPLPPLFDPSAKPEVVQ